MIGKHIHDHAERFRSLRVEGRKPFNREVKICKMNMTKIKRAGMRLCLNDDLGWEKNR